MSDQPSTDPNLAATGPTPDRQPPQRPVRPRRSALSFLALLLALAALVVAGWHWYESRQHFAVLQVDVAKRLGEIDVTSRETRSAAGQAQDGMRDIQARLGQLEARMAETQNQRLAIESLYRELSGSRDEWSLAEVEQILLIANQQLQLAGNVKAALIALETADSRLARMDRPQLTGLRRIISQDIERLKSAPHVDVIGMALRIDNLIVAVDGLPLAMEERVSADMPAAPAEHAGFWTNLWREALQDLRELVRIQNTAKPEVPLVSPDQGFFLRENLKLRLLGARLALLAHDEVSFKSDLDAASGWLTRYFDADNKAVAAAQSTIAQLAKSEVSIELPDISASLDAARNFKLVRERALR